MIGSGDFHPQNLSGISSEIYGNITKSFLEEWQLVYNTHVAVNTAMNFKSKGGEFIISIYMPQEVRSLYINKQLHYNDDDHIKYNK